MAADIYERILLVKIYAMLLNRYLCQKTEETNSIEILGKLDKTTINVPAKVLDDANLC